MSFLFKRDSGKEAGSAANVGADDPMTLSSPPATSSPQPISSTSSREPSISMPAFHPSSFNSSSSRLGSGVDGGRASFSLSKEESLTPPTTADLMRHTSVDRTTVTTTVTATPLPPPPTTTVGGLHPPQAPQGYGYPVLSTKLGAGGAVHHIYSTNVIMTPNTSLPNTPNAQVSYLQAPLLPSTMDLGPGIGQERPVLPHATYTPMNVATQPVQIAVQQQTPPTTSAQHATAAPIHSPRSTSSGVPLVVPSIPDEVTSFRHMFRNLPGLSRATFQLGDTLGTGTFGRVRIVTLPPDTATTPTTEVTTMTTSMTEKRKSTLYFALKMLKKSEIIRLKQVEHIRAEKAILSRITHPFIVNLFSTFQDDRYVYMAMEYIVGGELFSQLRKVGRFSSATAMFYAAEIISALEYLHSLQICYRDLKPENLLISSDGHIKITDFGFAKVVEDRTWTLCGTPEYLAPEIIQSKGHNKAVDWWALGILMFEMLAGYPPFYDENPFGIYQKILKGTIDFPKHIDPNAKDLIKKLLTADRTKRFGCLQHGADDIKNHPYFRGIDWQKVVERKYKPPFVPAYRAPNDTSNFDRYPDSREGTRQVELSEKDKVLFQDF